MPWFKVDDTFAFHAKALAAGNPAIGLWARAGAWSMQQLTDGFIPSQVAIQLGTQAQAQRLTDVGLWVEKGDGYEFHEWEQRQPSRVQLYADRDAATERQRRGREQARKKREREGRG